MVTLIPSDNPASEVWGVAYKIRPEDTEQVTKHLDFREKNGYSKKIVTFQPSDSSIEPFQLTLYVATDENESYAGQFKMENNLKYFIWFHYHHFIYSVIGFNLTAIMPDGKQCCVWRIYSKLSRLEPGVADFRGSKFSIIS